ncbi:MAG TPA: glycosyltransferase, partial [Thermoanaerobaculia bacterium]|nr:glycosyltransferase [Thermoanaerobaculia bacterium]
MTIPASPGSPSPPPSPPASAPARPPLPAPPPAPLPVLAGIVVHWRDEARLAALAAAWPGGDPRFELVVVDNSGSAPALTPEPAPAAAPDAAGASPVRLLRPGRNLGFAGGVNAGVAACRAPLLLLLNPDAVPEPGALERLIEGFAAHPEAAGLAPRLAGAAGRAGRAGSAGAAAELIVRQAAGEAPAGQGAGNGQQQSGRGVAAGGGPARAPQRDERQADRQAGHQAGARRERPGGAMMLRQVALEVAVVDPEERTVAQARDGAAQGMTEARGRPVEQHAAVLPQPARQVDVLEPRRVEALVEAAGVRERLPAQGERRRRRLLDRGARRRLRGEAGAAAGDRPGQRLPQEAPGRGKAAQLPGEL